MLGGRPSTIVQVNRSKTGRHGIERLRVSGIDIFTGRKTEKIFVSGRNESDVLLKVEEHMKRKKFTLIDIIEVDNDKCCCLLDEDYGSLRTISFPRKTTIGDQIEAKLIAAGNVDVIVTEIFGEEGITAILATENPVETAVDDHAIAKSDLNPKGTMF